jgi:hypothetical protein
MEDQELKELKRLFRGLVVVSRLSDEDLAEMKSRRRVFPDPLPRSTANQVLLESWGDFLVPLFGNGIACNLTGTYSDAYGYAHGLMLARNVIKDFRAFARSLGRADIALCIGVEKHPTTNRAVLHFHAMLGGDWTEAECRAAEDLWKLDRGWCVAKQVTDRSGCVEYAAKHLLKTGAADNFWFYVPGQVYSSRYERRRAQGRGGASA